MTTKRKPAKITAQKFGWGGARPNSGPEPTGVVRVQVMLHPETVERARTLGDGNVSAGVREAFRRIKVV